MVSPYKLNMGMPNEAFQVFGRLEQALVRGASPPVGEKMSPIARLSLRRRLIQVLQ